jgi:hypothetical protein
VKKALQVLAWVFLALDVAALLFFLVWALSAGSREGESAYALAFLLFAAVFVGAGGGLLAFGRKRASSVGLGCAVFVLGVPPLIALALWISNW